MLTRADFLRFAGLTALALTAAPEAPAKQGDGIVRTKSAFGFQETIDRLDATRFNASKSTVGEDEPVEPKPTYVMNGSRGDVSVKHESSAAAQEGGSNSNFRHLPNAFCWPARSSWLRGSGVATRETRFGIGC